MPTERSCGAVIYHKKKGYLLLKYGWGHWGFVKGNIEKGESEKDTILREAKEEAGIDKKDLHFTKNFREKISYFYTKAGQTIHKEVIYLLAETTAEDIRLSHEHTDFSWYHHAKAQKIITYKNDRTVLRKAQQILENQQIW